MIWSAIALSAFYVSQRPLIFQVIDGVAATLWAITLTLLLLVDSAGLGYMALKRIHFQLDPHERLIFGTGLGLGVFGFSGYGLGAVGLAAAPILAVIIFVILVCIFVLKIHRDIYNDLRSLKNSFRENQSGIPTWLPPAILISSLTVFLFTLLPPAEGFDGLSYHLRSPELLLKDGGILLHNIPALWYPSLIEGDYLWALGLGSERTAQMLHGAFYMLTLMLVWEWSRQVFGAKSAWWALAILASMPSLPWLSSWAYTDIALTFFGLACLYVLWRWSEAYDTPWLVISGLFAGMAMGVKYTSFILPLVCIIFVIFHERLNWGRITSSVIKFSVPALIISSPWYLRNWLLMSNPFYPFVFGGRYWDAFRANAFSGAGTGIGWDFREILLLPFTLTLGFHDRSYYDGRLGPLFLLLLPIALWAIWNKRSGSTNEKNSLLIINLFTLSSYLFWVFSVIQTIHLWQSRLLIPALIPFAIPIGLGITQLETLNLPQLRISYITTRIIGVVIAVTLIDNCSSLIVRRPLAYALGMESRQAYFERIQLSYAVAINLVNTTPPDAYVYFLFEPRSYQMPRKVQPDLINDNLAHDYYLFRTSDAIINDWGAKGYTHILLYNPGVESYIKNNREINKTQIDIMLKNLKLETILGNYALYSIP